MTEKDSPHRIALAGTGWSLWRDAAVRGAGIPARALLAICDDQLADAADRAAEVGTEAARYGPAYQAATERLTLAIQRTAADPLFREAVAWQNPDLVRNCLDKAAAGEPRTKRGRRHELAIAAYLQRYCLKNDTIGSFGPVGWARLVTDGPALSVSPGPRLLARRTCYFEVWAIDELARALARRPELADWLVPRAVRANVLVGDHVHRPLGNPVPLVPADAELLELCDGTRTVRELVEKVGGAGTEALRRLRRLGAVRVDLEGPVHAFPERALRRNLERITDQGVRDRALAPLSELIAARDAVAAAAGDPERLLAATDVLGTVFQRVTGAAPTRRAGQTYAGRTLVYEDAVRDVDVRLGPPLLHAVAGPLGLVLDSVRWLVDAVASRYRALFLELFEREQAASGADAVPLARLMLRILPTVTVHTRHALPAPVAEGVAGFQERWQRVLEIPPGARRHHVPAAGLAEAMAREFPPPATRRPPWSNARHHSPDVMLAAGGQEDVDRGDFTVVLGELHVAVNTIESRIFVTQHEDPARLLAAAEADHGDERVYALPRKDSPVVTGRGSPPSGLLSPHYTYWVNGGPEAAECPARPLPAAGLRVHRRGDRLVVRSDAPARELDLLEVVGELLSGAIANAFQPVPVAGRHRPRVTIDRLVLCREGWTFPAAELTWATRTDEAQRYLQARHWRARHRLPERVFLRAPGEQKPIAVDFRSLPLVNSLAKVIRQAKAAWPDQPIQLVEMVPDLDQLWLVDADGAPYTSELRLVAHDGWYDDPAGAG